MAQLIAEQKKDYLESPFHCPFCGSKKIKVENTRKVEQKRFEPSHCLDCKAQWTDVFTLYTVKGNVAVDMEIETGAMLQKGVNQ